MTQTPPDPQHTFGYGQQPGPGTPQDGPGWQGQSPRQPGPGQAPYGQGPQEYGQPGYGAARTPVDDTERTMMLLAHLSAPVSLLLSGGWLPFLGPLLIWLFYKDRSQAVRTTAAGAFNYNVSMTIVSWLLWISVFATFFIGLLWAIPLWIAMVIPHIIGLVRASNGRVYEYPFQIRILS